LIGDNRSLNSEIDKCLLTIMEYEKLNTDRALLNRKDVMRSLLDQVNNKLGRTSDQIAHLR
jgi:hypothetical protein